ncbi:MAG TPA: hypothetical protein VFN61_07005 [Acidimicrobiales bacterium]|nr:hypothetical protein [Acidimicrobiales bacterium]
MSSFDEIEKEARDHQSEVDTGIGDVEKEVDDRTGGRDQGMVDKGAQELEKEF